MRPTSGQSDIGNRGRVIVVMPAYNAAQTLEKTYKGIPTGTVDEIILVDDFSRDKTIDVAQSLGLRVFRHTRNYGYGANQKTCYTEALKTDCEIIVMLHPDYQYDPALLPAIIKPIVDEQADVVLGSRVLSSNPLRQGMPWWKYVSNRFLTALENFVFGLRLSEYHTGYRAYSRKVLEKVNFTMNSDKFVFDQDIIAQIVVEDFRIQEVPVPAKYFPEASSASLHQSILYGLSILLLLARYWLHIRGIYPQPQFDSFSQRYHPVTNTNTDSLELVGTESVQVNDIV